VVLNKKTPKQMAVCSGVMMLNQSVESFNVGSRHSLM
jgi:hypothetical protein